MKRENTYERMNSKEQIITTLSMLSPFGGVGGGEKIKKASSSSSPLGGSLQSVNKRMEDGGLGGHVANNSKEDAYET